MDKFNRKRVQFEDVWTSNEVGYKDSVLVTFYRKNQGVIEIAAHPDLSKLVYLTVNYDPVTVEGFPSNRDYDLISEFEDEDIPKIEEDSDSLHVASVLNNGVYDFLFYVSDPEKFLQVYKANKSKIACFNIELELTDDPTWEIYGDFP